MTLLLAFIVGVLFASGTYLMLQRTLTRIVLGLALLGHGVNVLLLVSGGGIGDAPLIRDGAVSRYADPLPQAMALTAIVITFGIMAFLLALAYRSWTLTHDDEVEDDVEDRRIAELHERYEAERISAEAVAQGERDLSDELDEDETVAPGDEPPAGAPDDDAGGRA